MHRALEKRSGKVSSNSNKEPERNLIMERTIKCCVLNGCFFWFSIVVFENFMMPALHWLVLAVLGATAGNALWGNVVPMLSVTFTTLWILPFYLLSKVCMSFLTLFNKFGRKKPDNTDLCVLEKKIGCYSGQLY